MRADAMKNHPHTSFMFAKVCSNDDVGAAKCAVFSEDNGRELISKPEISLKKSWGGYRRTTIIKVYRFLSKTDF